MYKQKGSGFSLLESMIVVAIIGILAAIAVPSYQDMIERNRLKQAAESLKSDMQFARTEAIKRSQDIHVSRSPGNSGGWCYGLAIRTASKTSCDCNVTDTSAGNYVFGDIGRVRVCTPNQPFTNWQNSFTRHPIGLLIAPTRQGVATCNS